MEPQKMFGDRVNKFLVVFLAIVSVFFIAKTVNEFKTGSLIGRSGNATNLITVNGKGEVLAVPDIATFTYSVTEESKSVAEAQQKATARTNSVLAYLKGKGVDDKDVKTTSYSIYPKYEYGTSVCSQGYCPSPKQTLLGYEVSQSIEVKVRKIDQAGEVLAGIGGFGVQNLSGLTLAVDKQDELVKDARTKAIADARTDADRIAKDLGVSIVRVVSMSENGGGNYYPYAAKSESISARDLGAQVAPQIPVGENKITSNVTITYEIF